LRDNINRPEHVTFSHHQRQLVEYSAIRSGLLRKTGQGVSVTLQLKTMQHTIHDRKINARGPMLDAQFFNDYRLTVILVLGKDLSFQGTANVNIIHTGSQWVIIHNRSVATTPFCGGSPDSGVGRNGSGRFESRLKIRKIRDRRDVPLLFLLKEPGFFWCLESLIRRTFPSPPEPLHYRRQQGAGNFLNLK